MTTQDAALARQTREVRRFRLETRWRRVSLAAALTLLFVVVGVGMAVAVVSRSQVESFGWFTIVIGDWVPTPLETMAVLPSVGLALLVFGVLLAPPPARRLPLALRMIVGVLLTVGVPGIFIVVIYSSVSF